VCQHGWCIADASQAAWLADWWRQHGQQINDASMVSRLMMPAWVAY